MAALHLEAYEVTEAADGLEALDLLRVQHPVAVVLDLSMPNIDGWQFLGCYQHLTGGPVPIIVFSAEMSDDLEQRLRGVGAQVCLAKPFDLDELLDQIERAQLTAPVPVCEPSPIEASWVRLQELRAAVTRHLDATHELLIRAEDSLGWSEQQIREYYVVEYGLVGDESRQTARPSTGSE